MVTTTDKKQFFPSRHIHSGEDNKYIQSNEYKADFDKGSVIHSRNEVNDNTEKVVGIPSRGKEKVANVPPELDTERLLGLQSKQNSGQRNSLVRVKKVKDMFLGFWE